MEIQLQNQNRRNAVERTRRAPFQSTEIAELFLTEPTRFLYLQSIFQNEIAAPKPH